MFDWLVALVLAGAVSVTAWRLGALSISGALAATLVGVTVLVFAGIGAAAVLVVFFVTASALSQLPPSGERSARSARQVFANGSVAAVATALSGFGSLAMTAFLGAVAAATADTWATEIGVRWGSRPRSLLTLLAQPPGTSGAVSLPGTGAALTGALAVAAAGHWWLAGVDGRVGLAVVLAGFGGSLVDSLLGASLQATYHCGLCGATPQVARHDGCTVVAQRVAGVPGLDNDAVNWVATAAGALLAMALSRLL